MARKVSLQEFKSMLKDGKSDEVIIHKQASGSEFTGDRQVKFTISTDAVDRDGDRINQKGWELKSFKSNPLVLWQHDASEPPIGRVTSVGLENGSLKAVVDFVPADNPWVGAKAQGILEMLKGGYLNAVSVGFKPLEYEVSKDKSRSSGYEAGIDFNKQALMELSIVNLPANPEALIERSVELIDPADLPREEIVEETIEEIKSEEIIETKETEIVEVKDDNVSKLNNQRNHRERILRLLKLS